MHNTEQLRYVTVCNQTIVYMLIRKKVKNINLRITKRNGCVVSAHHRVTVKVIDDFVISKGKFIINALSMCEQAKIDTPQVEQYTSEEFIKIIDEAMENAYKSVKQFGVEFPAVKLRKMSARWGTCYHKRGMIVLNKKLILVEQKCIQYVVLHELCHFIHPNHSKQFYDLLSIIMPDWKMRKECLAHY